MPILQILRALFHTVRAFIIFSFVRVLAVIVVCLAKAGVRAYCIVRVLWKKHMHVKKMRTSRLAYSILSLLNSFVLRNNKLLFSTTLARSKSCS